MIDHGRAIAQGTADQLKAQTGGERVEVVLGRADEVEAARRALAEVAGGDVKVEERTLTVAVDDGARSLRLALEALERVGVEILDVGLRRPTLDDVFLTLTGRAAEDDQADPTTQGASA